MKLIRAEFENFRLLHDLKLDFSTDRTLTVIRAENETGKTTILNGLLWALYGDSSLPNEGKDYRLHPIDWDASTHSTVSISVQVDFETIELRNSPTRGLLENKQQYRIIRSAFETLAGTEWKRTSSTVKLFLMEDTGSVSIDPPEARINELLPPELRNIFFTDGDQALSFIATTVRNSTKRERVQRAIRSLLGLGVIEGALKHVNNTVSAVNRAAKDIGTNKEIAQIVTELEQGNKNILKFEKEREDAKSQFEAFDESLSAVKNKIYAALAKGDQEELKRDIEQAQKQRKQINDQQTDASKEHSNLFRSLYLSRDLLAPMLEKGFEKLGQLYNQGKIPNTTIPVLEECLETITCICGESLDPNHLDGERRRKHIRHLIDTSQRADQLQTTLTNLHFNSRFLQIDRSPDNARWYDEYAKISKRRDDLLLLQEEQGKRLRALQVKLDDIPNTDIQGLRDTERYHIEQRDRFHVEQARLETKLEDLKNKQVSLNARLKNLLRKQEKGNRILAQLTVAQDVKRVLENAYNRITNEELAKVSDRMNTIFLEMIGVDSEQNAIIQKAEISKDFDIMVYGPDDRTLNPDRDLNGASRRALTLAFVLALTKVSEVRAPNVIDTPLGMMSGYVKKSVLKTAIRESSQLILFLTRSEIVDCEEILDAEAGRVITLTNPTHYPRMLVNDPQVKERKVLQCECNHRKECPVCQRRMDLEPEMGQTF